MRRTVLAALLAGLAALPAAAQPAARPPITPLRDVDVTYRLGVPDGGDAPLTQRMRWSVADGRLRVDPPSPGLYMIVDYRAKRMAVVKVAERAVLDVPTDGPGLPGAAAGGYRRQGGAAVAGLACTDWLTTDAAGRQTVLCLTDDGVMLRATQDDRVLLEATAVAYGPQDPAAFSPPDGFRHVAGPRP